MRESAKTAKRTSKTQLSMKYQAYNYCFQLEHFQQKNINQRVLCNKFRGKQTKFEPLYARKFLKRLKNLKNAT